MTNVNSAAQTLTYKLETLGIEDTYTPGEPPEEVDEWHHTSGTDSHAIIYSEGNSFSRRRRYGTKTRIEYRHSTETESWHCGTLNISFAHEPAHPDQVNYEKHDVEPDNAVYGVYIYNQLNWIKTVEDRQGQYDNRTYERDELLAVDADTPVSIEYVLDVVETAMTRLTTQAEATDDEDRQARIDQAEQHWNDDAGEYVMPDDEDQSLLSNFA